MNPLCERNECVYQYHFESSRKLSTQQIELVRQVIAGTLQTAPIMHAPEEERHLMFTALHRYIDHQSMQDAYNPPAWFFAGWKAAKGIK